MSADPFGTAALRVAVLRTWAASPARFREDANAEERLSIGYGGRVLAELAANAADAARAAGVPGELVIGLAGRELRVANNGEPLTAAGVAALAALRASAKRDEQVIGHFGVGFTAVRALTDDPVIVSSTGGVRFSASGTADAVAGLRVAELDQEIRRRQGQVPALRLPWPVPTADDLPPGCVTEVRLPLREEVDAEALAAGLTVEAATDLLWALPDLAAVTVPGFRVTRTTDPAEPGIATVTISAPIGGSRVESRIPVPIPAQNSAFDPRTAPVLEPERRLSFRVAQASGAIPAALLADRPVEERARDRWRLAWVLPLDADGRPDPLPRSVIGAPTPTEEPIGLPARLVGTLPVDESRSRVAGGPLAEHLIGRAAELYAELTMAVAPDDRPALIPPPGFPLGELDATLTAAVLDRLRRTAFLAGACGSALTPGQAVMVAGLSGPAARAVAEAMPGLLAWPSSSAVADRLRGLGVGVRPPSAVTAALAQVERPADFWLTVYDGLAGVPPEELADLPVPRQGGGTIIGPRGVLLVTPDRWAARDGAPTPGTPASAGNDGDDLAERAARLLPGLRLAAVDHPLLRRLGAEPADAGAILADPATAAEVRRRLDELDQVDPDPADLREFAGLMLDLLAAGAAGSADDVAVLADVLLTDTDGEAWPAGSLLLPGAQLAELLVEDADLPVVAREWVDARGPELLGRLGVRSGFAVRRYPAPPGEETDLPDVQQWWEQFAASPDEADTFDAVPDLDLVAPDRWPDALEMLGTERATRDALRPTGSGPSYTAWWIRRHAVVDGRTLSAWRTADASELAGLYDVLPVPMPPGMAEDLGVLRTLAQAAADPAELLARWADPARPVPAGRVPAVTAALADAMTELDDADLPPGVRTLSGAVIDAEHAAVLDAPWLAQVLDPAALVAAGADPAVVADALDLPLASERHSFQVASDLPDGPVELAALPGAVRSLDAAGREDLAGRRVIRAPGLAVRGDDGEHRVHWWCDGDRLLVDTTPEGIGRAVAHLAGRWSERHRLVATARGDGVEQAEAGLD